MNMKNLGTSLEHKEKFDRIIEGLFIFLFFTVPLSRAGINIIAPILTIFWVIKKIKYHNYPDENLKYPEIHKWIGILGIAVVLSFINVGNISAALKNFVDEYILFSLIFIISLDVIKNKELVRKLFFAALTSSFIVSAYGIYQYYYNGHLRISSTITGANEAGTYFVSLVLLGIAFLLFNKQTNRFKLIASFFYTLLNLSCVVFSGSRGAWLSLFAGFIILLFIALKNKQLNYKKVIIIFLIFILAAAYVDMGWVISRLDSINDLSNSSNQQRIMMATTGLRMLKDHPLFGVGIGQFLHVYPDYKLDTARTYTHIHCLYIHLAVEIGLIGLLSFLILVFKVLKTGLNAFHIADRDQWFYYGVIGVFVGSAVHNLFEWSFLNLQVGAFTLILVAIWLNKTSIQEG